MEGKPVQTLVSIVTVYYNRGDLVADSIGSLLSQTHRDIEIIAVDDGSTDETYDRLRAFDDERLTVIRHQNQGFVGSIRKGIEMARGDIIAIHGSGDISHPDRIARQLAVLAERPDVGVVGCYVENRNLLRNYSTVHMPKVGPDAGRQLAEANFLMHGEVMFRKQVYDAVGGYRPFFRLAQDRDLWLRMSERTGFHIVPEILYTRFVRLDGVGGGRPDRRAAQVLLSNLAVHCYEARCRNEPDPVDAGRFEALMSILLNRESSRILALCATELAIAGRSDEADALFRRSLASRFLTVPLALFGLFKVTRLAGSRLQGRFLRYLVTRWYEAKDRRERRRARQATESGQVALPAGE
ncbi:glycosyltransferase [Inquilinus sp. Marseille-Q2685]|uniref:glycosyltransferase n=1 Tax=Inquilinus sp. Marseille-Q2685 TaxID=2866581 RepID=UPI001CE3EC5A|nr:glycosyltransferase [Inquilinus sp. Marseille-Q2685]